LAVSLVAWLTDTALEIISSMGYPGVFLLMLVEGVLTPIPSELIVPFAGYLAAEGEMNLALVVAVGTAGAAVGNSIAYYIGYRAGRPLIQRYGKYIFLDERDVALAERWFARYGDWGVLFGHAIPGVRSFISFPAGIGKMRFKRFVVFSTMGALIWTSVLAAAGYVLIEGWRRFADTTENIDIYVLFAALAVMAGYIYWNRRRQSAGRE
jgi:membrane protein DedA with SNARE-associated domain